MPQAPDVWFRPLLLNTVSGGWCNLLRVRKSGILSRHRHPMVVVGYVIKGRWRYLEHDWIAEEGSFVYEPPGEIHTLTVPEDCAEMITFFNISGAMIYLDEHGRQNGYEDVWTKIDMCRAHYASCGLGAHYVEQFIRDDSTRGRHRRGWRVAALGLSLAQSAHPHFRSARCANLVGGYLGLAVAYFRAHDLPPHGAVRDHRIPGRSRRSRLSAK